MALKHNAQLVLSEVGGQGFWGMRGKLCGKKGYCNFKSLIFMPASDWCSLFMEQIEFACLDDSLTWPLQHFTNAPVHLDIFRF